MGTRDRAHDLAGSGLECPQCRDGRGAGGEDGGDVPRFGVAGGEGAVGGVVEDAPDAGHAHPYTPGRQTFAAAVEVHVLPLWVTFAPSG